MDICVCMYVYMQIMIHPKVNIGSLSIDNGNSVRIEDTFLRPSGP